MSGRPLVSVDEGKHCLCVSGIVRHNDGFSQVVYQDFAMVKLTLPYIAGFLAFREVDFLVALIEQLRIAHPELMPQVTRMFLTGCFFSHFLFHHS